MRRKQDNYWQRLLARKVRFYRRKAKLTQEEAAARASIDVKHWQDIESGRISVPLLTMARIATALGTAPWRLLKP